MRSFLLLGLSALLLTTISLVAGHTDPRKPDASALGLPPLALRIPVTPVTQLRLSNGLKVSYYPADYLRPYTSLNWAGQVPCTIKKGTYKPADRKLTVVVDFTTSEADERRLTEKIVDHYAGNGRHEVRAGQINLTTLALRKYELSISFDGKEYLLAKETTPRTLTESTAVFYVPSTESYTRLNKQLCDDPSALRVLFKAYYQQEALAGASMTAGTLHQVWKEVVEKLFPNTKRKPHQLLVDRDVLQRVAAVLASRTDVTLRSYGLPDEERKAATARLQQLVFDRLDKLPSVSLVELNKLAASSFIWTGKIGRQEVTPLTNRDVITKSTTASNQLEIAEKISKHLSDFAGDVKNSDENVWQELLNQQKGLGAKIDILGIFGAGASGHLKEDSVKFNTTKRTDISSARTFLKNAEAFKNILVSSTRAKLEGDMRSDKSFAKHLRLVRISSDVLGGLSAASISDERVIRTEEVSHVTELPLKVLKDEGDNLGIPVLLQRLREAETRIRVLERQPRLGALTIRQTFTVNDPNPPAGVVAMKEKAVHTDPNAHTFSQGTIQKLVPERKILRLTATQATATAPVQQARFHYLSSNLLPGKDGSRGQMGWWSGSRPIPAGRSSR